MAIHNIEADIAEYSDSDLITLMSFKDENEIEAKAAFNVFRKRHNTVLWQACASVCAYFHQSDELRDIVFNNTLLSIFESHSYDETKDSIHLWMFAIAKRELINALHEINPEEVAFDPSIISETLKQCIEEDEDPDVKESYESSVLKKAINTLSERDQEVLMTYHLYSDGNKHLPDPVIEKLKQKYHTTAPNLRKIKERATKKVIAYIESNSTLRTEKKEKK